MSHNCQYQCLAPNNTLYLLGNHRPSPSVAIGLKQFLIKFRQNRIRKPQAIPDSDAILARTSLVATPRQRQGPLSTLCC